VDEARRQFAASANSACTAFSIVLASTTKVDAIRNTVLKARKDLGNLRAAACQQPGGWRWRSVQVFGTVGTDAAAVVGRSLGKSRQAGVDGADCSWPARRHAEYQAWLFGLKRGLQPLGISSRPQREKDVQCADDVGGFIIEAGWRGDEIEPMPVLL
jgi:hypothetical protein